jgi:hypothetical protein
MTNCLVFIEQVAREQDLSKDWLNSKMVGFLSVQDRETDWLKWKTFGTVTYYVASTEYLFALKLNAGRPGKDSYDLKLLISELNIKSISHAEEIFERYFPGETPTEATTQLVLALLGDV